MINAVFGEPASLQQAPAAEEEANSSFQEA